MKATTQQYQKFLQKSITSDIISLNLYYSFVGNIIMVKQHDLPSL